MGGSDRSGPDGRMEPAGLYRYRFGTAEFDEARFELRVAGLRVEVQRKPLELLRLLLARAGQVVAKEELLERVWDGRPTVENVIANAMAKLRSALGAGNASRILTQPRVGYRFEGPLERIAVGEVAGGSFALDTGSPVPGRLNFILESLLRGAGQSEVWLARHAKTREPRVYKFGADGERLAALKREVTLSRVLHDNVDDQSGFARILDWNFESAPFFIEYEYGGQDLLRWSESEVRIGDMDLDVRMGLLLQLCDAVGAAHAVGVLHKDLKPANILVSGTSGSWRIRLTDFGSGRLLEPGRLEDLGITALGLTRTSAVLGDSHSGTMLYLAPELLAGAPPTVASDVYALGVMLYQLVVGDLRRPLVSGWERQVDDPLLREDIAAATDGDPVVRLATAAELARRLRSLEERRSERLREAVVRQAALEAQEALARNRARRPWVVLAIAILLLGLGLSLWLYRDARRSSARLDAMNEFLNWDVLANTGALKTDTDPDPSMRRVLQRAAQTVGERFAQDPGSEGWIRLGIGHGLGGLGDYAGAEAEQRHAVELLRAARGSTDERTLVASYALAMTLLEQSKFLDAERVLGEIDSATGSRSAEGDTAFKMLALRGMLRAARKQCEGALADLEAARAIELPTSPESTYNGYNVRSWIGESLDCLGRDAEARVQYEALLSAGLDAEVGPALAGYARLGYARSLQLGGDIDGAEKQMHGALGILENGIGEADPFTLGQALVAAGSFYADLGRFSEARAQLEKGRTLLLDVGEQQEKALTALRVLGTIDFAEGRTPEALGQLQRAHAGLAAVFGPDSPDAQAAAFWLAAAHCTAGDARTADELLATLDPAALRAAIGGSDWAERIEMLRAGVMIAQGRAAEGQPRLHSAAIRLRERGTPAWLLDALQRAAAGETDLQSGQAAVNLPG